MVVCGPAKGPMRVPTETKGPVPRRKRAGPWLAVVRLAEDRGFEPLRELPQHAFQVCKRMFAAGRHGL